MKLLKLLLPIFLCFIALPLLVRGKTSATSNHLWPIQSIDTMKYSRDMARAEKNDQDLPKRIDKQMKKIASTGATYVAIDTPYDDEFLPVLRQWVLGARNNHLSVWFRGNWSGWEGWFGYPKLSASAHIQKTQQFILKNSDLFQNGDIFTSCPECENGSLGDPRTTHQVTAYRDFLIKEYNADQAAFTQIGKQVASNYFSMNGDVALLVMNKRTTKQLGGIVVIDHYVKTPDQLAHDVVYLAQQSGGKIVMGEIGVPIPDIHGTMTDDEQAAWLADALHKLSKLTEVAGLNYWVNTGGSTELWTETGQAKPAVSVLTAYFSKEKVTPIPTPSPTIKAPSKIQVFFSWITKFVSGIFKKQH